MLKTTIWQRGENELTVLAFRRLRKNDHGVSFIEFALVAPIIIALVLGILEFGWIFNGWITITSAAREGARIATIKKVLPGDDDYDGSIEAAVENHVNNHIPTFNNVGVSVESHTDKIKGEDYESVIVKATGDIKPLVNLFTSETVTLSGKATMRLR